jgi:hypothetical protein
VKDLDFVEIGTCFYYTFIKSCADEHTGLSVEPLRDYLRMLPDRPSVTKVEAAIVAENDRQGETTPLYYVEPEVIDRENLGDWFKGCNSIGRPHDLHVAYYHDPDVWHATGDKALLKTRDLVQEGLVKIKPVPARTFAELVREYSVGRIGFLKIDVEGYDCRLVNAVLDFYDFENAPGLILFESNSHTPTAEAEATRKRLADFGYRVEFNGHDTLAYKTEKRDLRGREIDLNRLEEIYRKPAYSDKESK